jgi:hypothetical protein
MSNWKTKCRLPRWLAKNALDYVTLAGLGSHCIIHQRPRLFRLSANLFIVGGGPQGRETLPTLRWHAC